jgi:hypothetical protein
VAGRERCGGLGRVLLGAGSAGAVTLEGGDILVANPNSTAAPVILVDPVTGEQTALTGNAISPVDILQGAYDLVLDRPRRCPDRRDLRRRRRHLRECRGAREPGQRSAVAGHQQRDQRSQPVEPGGITGIETLRGGRLVTSDHDAFGGDGGLIGVRLGDGEQSRGSGHDRRTR